MITMQYPNEVIAKDTIVSNNKQTIDRDAFFQFVSSQKKDFFHEIVAQRSSKINKVFQNNNKRK